MKRAILLLAQFLRSAAVRRMALIALGFLFGLSASIGGGRVLADSLTLNAADAIRWTAPDSTVNPVTLATCLHTEGLRKLCVNSGLQIGDGFALDFWSATNSQSIYAPSSGCLAVGGSPTAGRYSLLVCAPATGTPFTSQAPSQSCYVIRADAAPATGVPTLGGWTIGNSTNPAAPHCPYKDALTVAGHPWSQLSFYGASPSYQPFVTGSWSDGTAGRSLTQALARLGLVYDATSP